MLGVFSPQSWAPDPAVSCKFTAFQRQEQNPEILGAGSREARAMGLCVWIAWKGLSRDASSVSCRLCQVLPTVHVGFWWQEGFIFTVERSAQSPVEVPETSNLSYTLFSWIKTESLAYNMRWFNKSIVYSWAIHPMSLSLFIYK